MNTLIIDTSTELATLVLKTPKGCFMLCQNLGREHSSLLFQKIDTLLNQGGVAIHNTDLLAVGIGPGSFTGVRIAISTARALSQTLKIPLVGIKSHRLLAEGMNSKSEYILVAFDAKKKRVFGALYKNNRGICELIPPGDYTLDFLLEKIPTGSSVETMGGGYEKYETELPDEIRKKSIEISITEQPKFLPEKICKLAESMYIKEEKKYQDPNNTKPFYARKSDAEIARDSRA